MVRRDGTGDGPTTDRPSVEDDRCRRQPGPTPGVRLSLLGGALGRQQRRAVGDLERSLPWAALGPSRLGPEALAVARRRWTELALNEHRSIVLMGQLVQALGEAQLRTGSKHDILVTLSDDELRRWAAQAVGEVQTGLERRGLGFSAPVARESRDARPSTAANDS